jgi:NAD(P)-dependent dehydrogenase (short-subunit alcohol dehydrogenase family)
VSGVRDLVCLVTGSTGIAASSARRLVAGGATVFVASRTAEHARGLADELTASGGRAAWLAADLADEQAVITAFGACGDAFGRIDAVFSVAGGSGRRHADGPIHELTMAGWDWTIAENLRSQALVAREAVRRMLGQEAKSPGRQSTGGRGSILLMSSVLASHPVPEYFATHAYAAAKGAIVSLGLAMAATYAGDGIRVNVVAPGLTATPMAQRAADDPDILAYARRKQPLAGGLVDPDDVAEAAVFLLGDGARTITGQVLTIDGGWSVVAAAADHALDAG